MEILIAKPLEETIIIAEKQKQTSNHIAIQKMGTIYKNRGAIWNTVRLNVGVKNQIIILDNNQLTNVSIGMNRQNILGLNTVPSQGSKAGTQFPDLKASPSWTVCATCCTYRVVLSISLKVWNRKLPAITTNSRQWKIKFKFDEKSIEHFWQKSS